MTKKGYVSFENVENFIVNPKLENGEKQFIVTFL